MASCVHYEESLEKSGKEKRSLIVQLDQSRAQLLESEKESAVLRSEVEYQVKSALKGDNCC